MLKEKLSSCGYKRHVSLNAQAEMVTSVRVTTGGVCDGHELSGLQSQDLDQGSPWEQ